MLNETPPCNIEMERAAILFALVDKDARKLFREELTPEDFYDPKLSAVVVAMKSLFAKRIELEEIALSEELKTSNAFAQGGFREFVGHLYQAAALRTAANIESEIANVKDFANRRRLHTSALKV